MNLFNNLQLGKIEWYTQKVTSLFLISPLILMVNYVFMLFFFCFLHLELGFHSILEDYYQNTLLRILVDFLFKLVLIFVYGIFCCTLILLLI
uniref:Succinate dehydrogenase subunit 4 n=1 Tax=Cyanophora sudae TaxID=1522369 RepID=A0A873WZ12_9EUKA|nr:succinate dehydrogenase subunit 4 [Cyanophora sudae]QPB15080.1 succinate dehydrogenase subunit 4 [Cyanophora sudae]